MDEKAGHPLGASPKGAAAGTSDAQLLDRARAGDPQALQGLVERHQAQVYRFGMRMCRDPEDARDVLQDTMLTMARSIRDFRGASSISTWLYTIARSFCIKKRRRSKFAPEVERSLDAASEVSQIAGSVKRPDQALEDKQVERALEQAIGTLEPMYREVLVLRDVEGLSASEVSEVLGIGVQAVKSRLHRARIAVREQLAPLLGIRPGVPPSSAASCPDVLTLFSRHLEDEISADVCAEMERHLDACDRCRATCDSLRRTLALCRTAGAAAEVPPAIQASVKVALRDLLAENG